MTRPTLTATAVVVAALVGLLAGLPSQAAGPDTTPPPTPVSPPSSAPASSGSATSLPVSSEPPVSSAPVLDTTTVRDAKMGLGWFLAANVDRPTAVASPCPVFTVDDMRGFVTYAGLVPSERDYTTTVVWNTQVGGGLVSLRCGTDPNASARPSGSTGWSLEATILDGQATFAQYAVQAGGRDVVIDPDPVTPGVVGFTACRNGGRTCTSAWQLDGLMITLRLTNLPADGGAAVSRNLLAAAAPIVVTNLTTITTPS